MSSSPEIPRPAQPAAANWAPPAIASATPAAPAAVAWAPMRMGDDAAVANGGESAPWLPPDLKAVPARKKKPVFGRQATPEPEEPVDVAREVQRAYAEGFQAGLGRRSEELSAAVTALQSVTRELTVSRSAILKDIENNLAALSLATARHLVGREIAADPSIVRELVTRGLQLVKPDAPITVWMNPMDLEESGTLLQLAVSSDTAVRWTSDPELELGSFRIESPQKVVDGRIEDALRILYERLVYE